VVNHCGRVFLGPKVGEDGRSLPRLDFDIEPVKFDPGEYRILSEALEREVSQILVEWDSPATQWRSAGADSGALLAEIAFLTTAVGAGKLEDALEQIRRNPHRRLRSETRWSPFGSAMPNLFLRDPLRHGRDWMATCSGHLPQEIEEERKFDSHDTAANRFVKFALGEFLQVCEAVEEADRARLAEGRAPSIAAVEAMRLGAWPRETLTTRFSTMWANCKGFLLKTPRSKAARGIGKFSAGGCNSIPWARSNGRAARSITKHRTAASTSSTNTGSTSKSAGCC
jgi:hypothetical protein